MTNEVPKIALELPAGDTRTANVYWSEMRGDTLHLCISVGTSAHPAAPQGVAYAELPKDVIRAVFIENGFTVKEGQTDLKQYVYDAANELLRRARLRASNGQAQAGAYKDSTPGLHVGDSSFESWYADYVKEGTKGLKQHCRDAYAAGMGDPLVTTAPTAQAADSVLEDAIKVLRADLKTSAKEIADEYAEDAARWQALPAFYEEYQIDAMKLYRDIDAYLAAARKQGGTHD